MAVCIKGAIIFYREGHLFVGGPEFVGVVKGGTSFLLRLQRGDQKKLVTSHHRQMAPLPVKNDSSLSKYIIIVKLNHLCLMEAAVEAPFFHPIDTKMDRRTLPSTLSPSALGSGVDKDAPRVIIMYYPKCQESI